MKTLWLSLVAAMLVCGEFVTPSHAMAATYDVKHFLPNFAQIQTHNLHSEVFYWPPTAHPGLFWNLAGEGDTLVTACGGRNSDGSSSGPLGYACDFYHWRTGHLYTILGLFANASDCAGPGYYCGSAPFPPIRSTPQHVDTATLPSQHLWYLGNKCPNDNQTPCLQPQGLALTQVHAIGAAWPGTFLRVDVYIYSPIGALAFSEHFWLGNVPIIEGGVAPGLRKFAHIVYDSYPDECAAMDGRFDGGPERACTTLEVLLRWGPK